MLAVVAIFGGRAQHRRAMRPAGGGSGSSAATAAEMMVAMWEKYRMQLLFCMAIVMFCVQTGLVQFVYGVVKDLPRLIKEAEEAEKEEEERRRQRQEQGGEQQENRNDVPPLPARNNDAAAVAAAEPQPRRLVMAGIRRVGRIAGGGGARVQDRNNNDDEAQRNPLNFANGGIEPRRQDAQRINNGILNDIKYFIGGFFLSLLPTWRPVVAQRVVAEGGAHQGEAVQHPPPPQPPAVANRDDSNGPAENDTGATEAHVAAKVGDLETLKRISLENPENLLKEDNNGWQPLHEAARSGFTECVIFLVEEGADLNHRTNNGEGGTPLWEAKRSNGNYHPVVELLESLGGLDIGPEE